MLPMCNIQKWEGFLLVDRGLIRNYITYQVEERRGSGEKQGSGVLS